MAGILDLCDKIVELISAAWGPPGSDSVERVYTAPVTVKDLVGRKVYVFPGAKMSQGAASRGEDRFNWLVGIVIVEKCPTAGIPPVDWMDANVSWVEDTIEDTVDFDGREGEYLEFDGRTLWTLSIETEIYDVDRMDEQKLFYSKMEIVFDEIAENEP